MSGFQIDLVGPNAKLVNTTAFAVSLPSVEGEMTAMLGHAPLVCALDAGLVRIYATSLQDTPQTYFVSGGFCDVSETGCTILAEEAQEVSKLNAAALDATLTDLAARLDGTTDTFARHQIEQQMAVAQTKRRFAV